MDETKLREMYKSDRVARAFLDHMIKRERIQRETKIDRILDFLNENENNRFSRGDIIGLFKKLQCIGCGQYVIGRRGGSTRFVWDVRSLSAIHSMYLKDLGVFVLLAFQMLSETFGSKSHTRVLPEIQDIQNNIFCQSL